MIKGQKTFVFIHQNMPGQFSHIVRHLAAAGHKVFFITKRDDIQIPGVARVTYKIGSEPPKDGVQFVRPVEDAVLHARAAAKGLSTLKEQGVRPDVIIGHSGWGELLFAKEVFPDVPLVAYLEYYFRSAGADVDFDPEYPSHAEIGRGLLLRNMVLLSTLDVCDRAVTPTVWQWSRFPAIHRPNITVLHEGVDTATVRPNPEARFELPDGRVLEKGREIVTYVSRNLEPYRGFHVYMRALAELCRRRPNAEFLVVGGDEVSYGAKLPNGQTYRQKALAEVAIDETRVHFLGRVPYGKFLSLLQVSSAHVYLTYPFVLSWSLVEAMAAGCVVVGSRTAPVEEVIADRRNGRLVDFFDPNGIAETVAGVLDGEAAHAPLRQAARATAVEHFDLHNVTLPRHMALIRDLL